MLSGSWESRSRSTRLEPMKPAEPVTKMVLVFCDISFFAGQGSFVGHPAIAFGSSALPRHHQLADGLIHHRPAIDGQKLLADSHKSSSGYCDFHSYGLIHLL